MRFKEAYWVNDKNHAIKCQQYLINKGYTWGLHGRIVMPEYNCEDGTLYVVNNYGEIYYGDFSLEEARKQTDNRVIVFKSSRINLMETE